MLEIGIVMLMGIGFSLKTNVMVGPRMSLSFYSTNDIFHQIPEVEKKYQQLELLLYMDFFVVDQLPVSLVLPGVVASG